MAVVVALVAVVILLIVIAIFIMVALAVDAAWSLFAKRTLLACFINAFALCCFEAAKRQTHSHDHLVLVEIYGCVQICGPLLNIIQQ